VNLKSVGRSSKSWRREKF